MPRQTNIQIRRGSASDWASTNPTLAAGELAMEQDTFKIKVGDGSTAWNSLQYLSVDGGSLDEGGATTTTTAAPTTTTTTAAPLGGFTVTSTGSESPNKLGLYCPDGTFNGRPVYKKDGPADEDWPDTKFPKYIYYTTNANIGPGGLNGWAQSPDLGNNQSVGGFGSGGIYAFTESDAQTPPGTLTGRWEDGQNGNLILTPANC